MRLDLPIKWLYVQGNYGHVSSLYNHVGLYAAYAAGDDGRGTEYEKQLFVRGKNAEQVEEILARRRQLAAGPPSDEPIPVVLNSQGRFELTDGHHRAARAVYENAATVPVKVVAISPSWENMVASLAAIYPGKEKKLYQEIEHPYFADWEVSRSPRRLELVCAAVGDTGIAPADGDYLEIGSCTGRMAREFNRRGWACYGADLDRRVVSVAEFLNGVFDTIVSYHCTPDWFPLLYSGPGWGVIVCLSVFHSHHTAGEHELVKDRFRRFLDRSKVFITDGDVPGREYGGGVAWPEEQYREWLTALAAPTHKVQPIGITENRTIYLCQRIQNV